jgi:hypothetical protein
MDAREGSNSPSLNLGNKIFFLGMFFQRMERFFVKSLHAESKNEDGGGGDAQRSILHVNEVKKTGERSARARSAAKTH